MESPRGFELGKNWESGGDFDVEGEMVKKESRESFGTFGVEGEIWARFPTFE